jgi:hypothetical protein
MDTLGQIRNKQLTALFSFGLRYFEPLRHMLLPIRGQTHALTRCVAPARGSF